MKIVVIGGTGLIGSRLVSLLAAQGHQAVAASPGTGVNTLTGDGLAEVLQGADVVVDVSNSPSFEPAAVLEFFETSTRNLLAAEAAAGVGHHVALSVVGTERLPESGYFRAKIAQEKLIEGSSIPYSIVHATQFFEFLAGIVDSATDGSTVHLAHVLIQPMAADDVAAALCDVTVGTPRERPRRDRRSGAVPPGRPRPPVPRRPLGRPRGGHGRRRHVLRCGAPRGHARSPRRRRAGHHHPRGLDGPDPPRHAPGREGVAQMTRIVIVGGGYAGFYAAWNLEKRLRPGEAEIVVIDPRPYMTYQPFLPEVMAGSVEARHAAVSLRRHLRRSRVVAGEVTRVEHARRTVQVRPADGDDLELTYDIIVITAGAVTRTFPVPGVAEQAIGMKHVEEAVAIRDRLLTAFDRAAALPPGPERQRLLTVTFVGGGFSGVEGFGELLSLATSLLPSYPELSAADLSFHLVEAAGRILPEVTEGPGGGWCARWRSAARTST